MNTPTLPLCGRQSPEEDEGLLATCAERSERQDRVVSAILSVLGQANGIERQPDAPTDAPALGVRRHVAEREKRGLVRPEHHVEPEHEQLLDIPQMADDLLGRPVSLVRAARQRVVRLLLDGPREIIRSLAEALQSLFDGLTPVLVSRGLLGLLPWDMRLYRAWIWATSRRNGGCSIPKAARFAQP